LISEKVRKKIKFKIVGMVFDHNLSKKQKNKIIPTFKELKKNFLKGEKNFYEQEIL